MTINLDPQIFMMPDILVMLDDLQQPSEIRVRFLKMASQEVIQDILELNRYPAIQIEAHLEESYIQITLPPLEGPQNRAIAEQITGQMQTNHNLKIERLFREGSTWLRRDCKPIRTFTEVDFSSTQAETQKALTLLKTLNDWGLVLQWSAENNQLILVFCDGTQKYFERHKDVLFFLEGMQQTSVLLEIPSYYNQQILTSSTFNSTNSFKTP